MVYITFTRGDKKCSVNHIPSLNYDLQPRRFLFASFKIYVDICARILGKIPDCFEMSRIKAGKGCEVD